MFRDIRRKAKLAGLPPGVVLPNVSKKSDVVKLTVVKYDKEHYHEWTGDDLGECPLLSQGEGCVWIHIQGMPHAKLFEQLTERYHIHPLTIEDITNASQRPKLEEFEHYQFVVLKSLTPIRQESKFKVGQMNLLLGKNFVISIQEDDNPLFHSLYARMQSTANQRMREQGSDYLFYRLMDIIVDYYFVALEAIGEEVDSIEENIISNPQPKSTRAIYRLKRRMLLLRKIIWPAREVVSHLLQAEEKFITPFTRVYFRDVYDHIAQAIDSVETFRDMLTNMLDIYLSSLTNRMNEIMKTLTIIATIFIPMTFVASVYGMNFNIPELQWRYGYFCAIGLMSSIAIVMLVYFRIKRWI